MQIFTLIPLGTWISISTLVVFAIAALMLRLNLDKELKKINSRVSRLLVGGEEEGIQPEIVKRLRHRYQKASQKLEHVNTLSLIDSTYKDERVSFLGFKIQFDRADGITRAFPNLLIAFGLIGTFWGITSNLTSISSIVTNFSQTNPDINKLVQGLQSPLRDMGVAFSTSLFGLLFGSVLTIINTIFNTSITKYQLISSLEDYLDNIYKPTLGDTRLDIAIDRMVRQQQEFLTRFHENVGAVLERTFGKAANQIADECGRTNKIAEYVYSNFSNAAGTISTGADKFNESATLLEKQVKTTVNLMPQLENVVTTFSSAANQIEIKGVIIQLNTLVQKLSVTQSEFTSSTQTLSASLEGIVSRHLQSTHNAEKVYEGLEKATISMQSSAGSFVSASQIMGDISLAADLATTVNKLQNFQTQFNQSTTLFNQAVRDIKPIALKLKPAISSLDRTVDSLSQKMDLNQSKFDQSTTVFSDAVTNFQPIASELQPAIASLDRTVNALSRKLDLEQ